MRLSYVIITRNRCQNLLSTLGRLHVNTHLPAGAWEVIVVDNASEDDTVAAVHQHFRDARVIVLPENEGMPARNHGIKVARGRLVCFLDDDSYPTGRAIPDALGYLAHRPKVAALVARVELPGGGCEAPAFPAVTMGGATIVRKSVLDEVGGFAPEFFRQAEEYDLSFRIWRAGYRVDRLEDVVFCHEKVTGGRSPALVHRMDLRNNLILAERYLPPNLRRIYRHDFIRRYAALAVAEGHGEVVNTALHEARVWARRERLIGRKLLDPAAVEALFGLERQAKAVAAWAKRHAVRRVAIADYAKNLYATFQACRRAGLVVAAVADDREAFRGPAFGMYRGSPVVPTRDLAIAGGADGVVVATLNPAQVDATCERVARHFAGPVLRLWEPQYLVPPERAETPRRASA